MGLDGKQLFVHSIQIPRHGATPQEKSLENLVFTLGVITWMDPSILHATHQRCLVDNIVTREECRIRSHGAKSDRVEGEAGDGKFPYQLPQKQSVWDASHCK